MQIPKYDDLFNPLLLAFHQLGGSASVPQMEKKVAEILNLTETELNEPHRGSRTKFQYNLASRSSSSFFEDLFDSISLYIALTLSTMMLI